MARTITAETTDETTATGRRTGLQTAADLAFLARAMKAPALLDAAGRLEERARKESWTHAKYLVACLQREVAARESHGGEARVRAARFPAIKTLEELDVTHLRGLTRQELAHLGTLDFIAGKENVVFLGPPGTGKTHLATGLAVRACQAGHRVAFSRTQPNSHHRPRHPVPGASCFLEEFAVPTYEALPRFTADLTASPPNSAAPSTASSPHLRPRPPRRPLPRGPARSARVRGFPNPQQHEPARSTDVGVVERAGSWDSCAGATRRGVRRGRGVRAGRRTGRGFLVAWPGQGRRGGPRR